jgi:hypothetical protein
MDTIRLITTIIKIIQFTSLIESESLLVHAHICDLLISE